MFAGNMSHQGYSDYILYSDKCLEAMREKGRNKLGKFIHKKENRTRSLLASTKTS